MQDLGSTLRAIPGEFANNIVAAIDQRLETVATDERLVYVVAAESGSRAWGFPSPDSDYDCRFIYIRQPSAYLSLWPPRDVIETPMDGVLDVNGWDIVKALRLLVRGNAVAIEWLRSPIVYRGDATLTGTLLRFAEAHAPLPAIANHYRHLAIGQIERHLSIDQPVAIKKIFYMLRPATAMRWMRMYPGRLPPMHFPTLLAESEPDQAISYQVAELIALKASQEERAQLAISEDLRLFITGELEQEPTDDPTDREAGKIAADRVFAEMLHHSSG